VHYPIALILCATAAELIAMATGRPVWQSLAVIQTRAAALCALGTAAAGWLLAGTPDIDRSLTLEWHRWLALFATGVMLIAAATSFGTASSAPRRSAYRVLLFVSAAGTGLAAHLGATLVWGAHFFNF
jgi:uncharacterized membrane protein